MGSRRRVVSMLLLCVAVLTGYAATRKELKNLASFVKTSNFAKGRQLVDKCLADSTINGEPRLYELAIALEVKANDAENMKLYLKQKYDTAAFFNTTYRIVELTLLQEKTIVSQPPSVRKKAEKKYGQLASTYYPNLYNGGLFFVKHQQWDVADKFFSQFINVSHSPIVGQEGHESATKLPRAAFWSMRACYEGKKYPEVFKFTDLAEADTANLSFVVQYEALAYEQLRDTANYVRSLKRGIQLGNSVEFFFSRLTDYYNSTQDYPAAYALNDSLLRTDSLSALYLYAQTIVLFNMKEYDKCIDNTLCLLRADSTSVEANYYLGLCWYNKGLDYDATLKPNPTSKTYKADKQKVNNMFRSAMPYLEAYRAARPKEKERWQAPLYRIYFSLNLSEKLKELEK